MSADNFVGVRPNADGTYVIFPYGNMSVYSEDCMYLANDSGEHSTAVENREKALVQAHDLVNEMDVCEYGVVEMQPVPDKPCGGCWVCVHERGIAKEDLPKCTGCGKPISSTEWMSVTAEGQFHRQCEPKHQLFPAGSAA